MDVLLSLLVAALSGTFVGATSIGGFLVAPTLVILLSLSPAEAVMIALASFIPSSVIGSLIYFRRRQVDLRLAVHLSVFGLPGIFVGVWVSRVLSDEVSARLLALLLTITCFQMIVRHVASSRRNTQDAASDGPLLSNGVRTFIIGLFGLLGGIASTLAGIGGPVVYGPILMSLGYPPARVAGTGIFASSFFSILGLWGLTLEQWVDPTLTLCVASAFTIGVIAGARVSAKLKPQFVAPVVVGLCAVAIVMLI